MKSIITILTVLLFLPISKTSNIPSFKIEVVREGDRVEMKCTSGCNWKELGFSLKNGTSIVNPEGIHFSSNVNEVPNGSFSFKVEPSENGLKFISVSGTAWKEVSYGVKPSKIRYLDQHGVTIEK